MNGTDTYYNAGNVGIGTDTPIAGLQVETDGPWAILASSSFIFGQGVRGWATHPTGGNFGGWFGSDSSRGIGVFGDVSSSGDSVTIGVKGLTRTSRGRGVYGLAGGTSGGSYGVYGDSRSSSGIGVQGAASAASGTTYGVKGVSLSPDGYGVYGWATDTSGTNYGVYGLTNSPEGYAGYFLGGRNYFEGNVGIGTESPAVELHLRTQNLGVPQSLLGTNEDFVIESTDANLRLISDPDGFDGSTIVLSEFNGTEFTDNWLIGRKTSGAGSGLDFRHTNGHVMRLEANGNVGIGTTAPGALLEIQADQNVSEYLRLSGFDNDSFSTRPVFKFRRARGSAAFEKDPGARGARRRGSRPPPSLHDT